MRLTQNWQPSIDSIPNEDMENIIDSIITDSILNENITGSIPNEDMCLFTSGKPIC